MTIVVNDANILIDFVKLQLLPHFFALDKIFFTSDLVIEELHQLQYEALLPYIDSGRLQVSNITAEELIEIAILRLEKNQLSEQDCSALYFARQKNGALITSDNTLRKFAKEKQIEVHGHLWVFDLMRAANTITSIRATEKLKELCEKINPKLGLPKAECDKRFKSWEKE